VKTAVIGWRYHVSQSKVAHHDSKGSFVKRIRLALKTGDNVMNRLCRIPEVVLVLLCPLLALEALAQETLSGRQYCLVGVQRRVFLCTMEKPRVGVTDQEYGRLTQQIELRLREAGFRVMSGTMQDYEEHLRTSALQGSLATAYSTQLIPEIKILPTRARETGDLVYAIVVGLQNGVFAVGKDSHIPYVLAIQDPKDPGKTQTVCSLRGIQAYIYIRVVHGVALTWSTIHSSALQEVDGFIDDYLIANPRT